MKYKPTVKNSSLDADNTLVKGDDDIIVDEKTTYNEWLAVQGLVRLSEDQLLEGEIRKLHNKGNKSKSSMKIKKKQKLKLLVKKLLRMTVLI